MCSSKGTIYCFGEGIPLNLLTLIQGSAILSGTQSGRQLATQLGLCSRSGLPVSAEPASTCWVFTLNVFVLILILAYTRKRREKRGTLSEISVVDITEEIREEEEMSGDL